MADPEEFEEIYGILLEEVRASLTQSECAVQHDRAPVLRGVKP